MPGIAGIIGPGKPGENEAILREMAKAMTHETFYTAGSHSNEALGISLGWVSLAGSFSDGMPVWNETKDIGLVLTGEDFTDAAEIERLKARGHALGTEAAAYLVHLYEDLGDRFVEKLNGRFSGVLMDFRTPRIILFNDRYVLGRVYYCDSGGKFYFSSEAKALLKVLPELRRLDHESLAETFSCGCVLRNRTLFAGVSLLPGGSAWTFVPGEKRRESAYFRPDTWENQEPLGAAEYYEQLKQTWQRILPRYTHSREPLAVSLTGGKDSRMILAWAPFPPGTVPCYTFGGIYRDCGDVKLARRVAEICGQPHQVIRVDKAFLEAFPELAARTVYVTDGAMDVTGAPDLFANRIARGVAPVRLTGNYGQEILYGSVAFKPVSLDKGIFEKGFGALVDGAARTYAQELAGHLRSFISFKQVPWHHFSRLGVELSQLTLRSPFLDNDLVGLTFRTPPELATAVDMQLRLIAEGNAALGRIGTDRGLLHRPIPLLTTARHFALEFTFKA